MKIAAVQMIVSHDKQRNLEKILSYITKAKSENADLVVFPEASMAVITQDSIMRYADIAESIDGHFIKTLATAARQYSIYVICSMYESKASEKKRAYNTTVFLDDQGTLIHKYRKVHLYDAFSYSESENIIADHNNFIPVRTRLGTIAILVCYELRFPEISRTLTLQGANILIIPTAWTRGIMKEEHLLTLSKARAIENTVFVCVANQVGGVYTGHSTIYNPMGVVIANKGEGEGLLLADINHDQVLTTREKLPVLKQRHPELYKLN
ncbi:MAG: putative amidohydrolase [Candidatus Tokpelaia sp. JSC085]|nr:MAG: putative amidohydrolase [Candidatus Tokpelaia sp. JSC085]